MTSRITATQGRGKYKITGIVDFCGKDLNVQIYGGTHPHVGSVALAFPRPSLADKNKVSSSTSVLCGVGHKEDGITRNVSLEFAKLFNCAVSVTCGIHVDNCSPIDMEMLSSNAEQLMRILESKISETLMEQRAQWLSDEHVVAVDQQGNILGTVSRKEAHTDEGILHQAFEVFLINSEGKLILCRRSSNKKLWGGCLAGSCAGHPYVGEDAVKAAQRRVHEELKVDVQLQEIGSLIYREKHGDNGIENEYCSVLVGFADNIEPNQFEIEEVVYLSVDEIEARLRANKIDFAPWTKLAFENVEILRHIEKYVANLNSSTDF